MSDHPDHSLVLDLTRVLRELSDRQGEMLAVVRRLRLELSDRPSPPARPGPGAAATTEPRPPALVAQVPVPVPSAPGPQVSRPRVSGPQVSGRQASDDLTPRPTRDYDYFDDLDARLARLRDGDPEAV
jgi:hypothetical protein